MITAGGKKGGDKMLQNLSAEMKRYGVSPNDISRVTKKSERSIRLKISGKNAFSYPDAAAVRDALFPGLSLEYLFARPDDAQPSA